MPVSYTHLGAVKGVTVDQVEQLKQMALRSVTDRHKVQELTEENTRLRSQVPSMKKRLEEAQRQQRLEQENRRLRDENYYLQSELQEDADAPASVLPRSPARNGRHGAVKEACPEGLKISFGQAIITTENRELLY